MLSKGLIIIGMLILLIILILSAVTIHDINLDERNLICEMAGYDRYFAIKNEASCIREDPPAIVDYDVARKMIGVK